MRAGEGKGAQEIGEPGFFAGEARGLDGDGVVAVDHDGAVTGKIADDREGEEARSGAEEGGIVEALGELEIEILPVPAAHDGEQRRDLGFAGVAQINRRSYEFAERCGELLGPPTGDAVERLGKAQLGEIAHVLAGGGPTAPARAGG